jgi:hypothetical protein
MKMIKELLNRLRPTPALEGLSIPPDMEPEFLALYERFREFSMTSIERMYALYQATKHILDNQIGGDIVECGVWRGGSMMMCAAMLAERSHHGRKIYLYDTFAGMTEPGEKDIDYSGDSAKTKWWNNEAWKWTCVSQAAVRTNFRNQNLDSDALVFVEGNVMETIPAKIPQCTALLHLDTDWYDSTRHELIHLFPSISHGGVIIIDDYGHFRGAREAVDDYIRFHGVKILLSRIDYTGRLGVVLKN